MTKYIRLMLCMAISALAAGYAGADSALPSPVGEWLVQDRTAHLRLAACDGRVWGVISWAEKPDTDTNNPDISKRNRPVLGLPILLGLRQTRANRWEGDIYNAENGKTYSGGISLKSSDTLHIEGCVLGILCGGEDWQRLADDPKEEAAETLCGRLK